MVSDGEPVGWSVCGGQFPRCWVSVGWCATVPAVSLWDGLPVAVSSLGAGCRMVSLSDGLPVAVSSLGAGCRSDGEPVGCVPQFQR